MLCDNRVIPNSIDVYLGPKISAIIPFVGGTVESHNNPKILENTKTDISFIGDNIKRINKIDLKE
tara:strand:+ start:528 stop:722 length:195 start_codon:yes stop_codon:yes gene_type:complete